MKHCCQQMESAVASKCQQHTDRWDCPDALIAYSARFDEYGIIIHDGGSSKITITYCPWCGAKLPESQADRWFNELEALGFADPFEDDIPEQYNDVRWRRSEADQTISSNGGTSPV
jgi:hypothetical protein